jgi:hypothetical protein
MELLQPVMSRLIPVLMHNMVSKGGGGHGEGRGGGGGGGGHPCAMRVGGMAPRGAPEVATLEHAVCRHGPPCGPQGLTCCLS